MVLDVSWGLINGRSYHHIVSCGDAGVFVWKFKIRLDLSNKTNDKNLDYFEKKYFMHPKNVFVEELQCFSKNILNFYPVRCTWNYMCTVIAVSYSNKNIILLKKNLKGEWIEICRMSAS